MRQAKNLLYGPRQSPDNGRSLLLREAEIALTQGSSQETINYLLTYPQDLGKKERLDKLVIAITESELAEAVDKYKDEGPIRPILNGADPDLSGYRAAERSQLIEDLKRPGNNYDSTDLAHSLLLSSGPMVLRALEATGLDAKIIILLRYYGQSETIGLLHDHLCWRLLAEAEKNTRLLSQELGLTDHLQPAIGVANYQLHYLFNYGQKRMCDEGEDHHLAMRGAWRSYPRLRCRQCISKWGDPDEWAWVGSDDPNHYTLLSNDTNDYHKALETVADILREQAAQFKPDSDRDKETEQLNRLCDETYDRINDLSYELADKHRRNLGQLLADRVNTRADDYRDNYAKRYLSDELYKAHNDLFGEDEVQDSRLWLDNELAADWFADWYSRKQPAITIKQTKKKVEACLGSWLQETVAAIVKERS